MKNNKHQHLLYRTPLSCATVGRCQTNKALIRLGELLRVLRPTLSLLCKHRFPALAAILLLLLPCSLYLFLRNAPLGRLRLLPALPPKPLSDYLILLLYKHPSWQGVRSLYVSCTKLAIVNVYKKDKHLLL
jgi:hypothetical protein